jgi:hypothetical protein
MMRDHVTRSVNATLPGRRQACLVLVAGMLLATPLYGQQGLRAGKARITSAAVLERLPMDQLTLPARKKIQDVVSRPSLHRSAPARTITCSKDLYAHLVQHPEIVVNLWQLMGITELRLKRTGPFTYKATDGSGTSSTMELIFSTPELHIFYAEGSYAGKWLGRRLQGRCLVILTSEFSTEHARPQVKHRIEVFIRLDDVAADVLARTLKPLIGKLIQYNFEQSSGFIEQIHEAAENRQPGMERMVSRMTHVEPTVKDRFVHLLGEIPRPLSVVDTEDPALRR